MSNNYLTGVCAHCGADYGLHQSEAEHCPKNGIEETREYKKQQWEETTFKDSGEKKLEDAAPELLEALQEILLLSAHPEELNNIGNKAKSAILKATI